MRVRLKGFEDFTADAPRGRIGQALASFALKGDQFVVHLIPFLVGNGGGVEGVVFIGGRVQAIHQFAHTIHFASPYPFTLMIGATAAASVFFAPDSNSTVIFWPSPAPETSTTRPRPSDLWKIWSPAWNR